MILPLLITGLLCIVFLSIGIGIAINYKKKMKQCTQRVSGKVVDNIARRQSSIDDHTWDTYYYPVVEYYVNGQYIKKEISIGTSKPKYEVGTSVTVLVQPDNVNHCYIEGDNGQRWIYSIFLIVGIILLCVSLVLMSTVI